MSTTGGLGVRLRVGVRVRVLVWEEVRGRVGDREEVGVIGMGASKVRVTSRVIWRVISVVVSTIGRTGVEVETAGAGRQETTVRISSTARTEYLQGLRG
jgi:hypothetical protein